MKKTVLDLFRFSAILLAAVPSVLRADIDFSAFAHKAYITFSGYEGETTLTNFPALVRLADGVGGFAHADCALAGGRDVRFSLGDGRELPSEVVSWNANGTSEFYVRVPELAGKSTRIMVFWGNAAAPTRDPRQKVWDRSYTGVYGMEETGKSILDSSWTGAHGLAANDSGAASGAVGGARGFSAENAVYGNGTVGPVANGKSFTMECWFKYSANPSQFSNLLIFNRPPTEKFYYTGIAMRLTPEGKLGAYAGDFSGTQARCQITAAEAAAKDEWHHALATFRWSETKGEREMHLYQDGAEVGSAGNFDFVWTENQPHLLWTGFSDDYNSGNKSVAYTGQLDEVRVSDGIRSGDYAAAVYKNVADYAHFATMADATSEPYAETTPAARPRHSVTVSAGAGGTVSPSGTTVVEEGETITVTATPASASYGFHSWGGDCPELEKFSSSVTLEVHSDISLEAVFGKAFYVAADGDDLADGLSAATAKASIQTAVAEINQDAASFPAVLFVAPGTYTFDNGKPDTWGDSDELKRHWACYVTNALAIRATAPRQAVVDFRRRDNCDGFLLDNDGALLEGLVLSNAYSSGYAVAIDARLRNGHMKDCAVGWSSMAPYARSYDVDLFRGWIRDSAFTSWKRSNGSATAQGGLVFMKGGIVDSCVFSDCENANAALTIHAAESRDAFKGAGGTVRNCLFEGNSNFASGGAITVLRGYSNNGVANIENCTFVGNSAKASGGAVHADSNGGLNLVNCAFLGNSTASEANGPDFWNAGLAHSVSVYADGVDGNVVGTPTFKETDDGTYQPTGVSLTGDAGFPLPWALHPVATDLYGNARLHGAAVDIGAAEYVPSGDEELEVNVAGDVLTGTDTLTVNFSALVSGAGSQGLSYAWDFGDGTTSAEAAPSHAYSQAGYYTVSLTVTDVATGKTAATASANMIKVIPTVAYVRSPDDGEWTPVEPYATYETAAATLLDAFNLGTAKIACGPGTIVFGNDRILAMRSVEIYGLGRRATEVNCNGNYIHLGHPGAILRDLTLFNTYVHTQAYEYQGAVNIYGGAMVSNCVIRNPKTDSYTRMVWIRGGGRLVDSEVVNSSSLYGNMAIGAFVDGPATIDRCVFSNLTVKATANNVCAILVNGNYSPAPVIRNTLIADCRIQGSSNPQGSAIYASGKAIVENCTIAGNYAKSTASGKAAYAVYAAGDGLALTNTVVWGNVCTNIAMGGAQTVRDVFVATGKAASLSHGDFAEAETIASASVTTEACFARDPLFRNAPVGNFTFGSASPLVNAGIRLPWMAGARDLDGYPRLLGRPDIGCFESQTAARTLLLVQ